MNRNDFVRLYAKTFGVTIEVASSLCKGMFNLMAKTLYEDEEDITINGFGSFKVKRKSEKRIRHPKTREFMIVPPKKFIKFTPSDIYFDGREE